MSFTTTRTAGSILPAAGCNFLPAAGNCAAIARRTPPKFGSSGVSVMSSVTPAARLYGPMSRTVTIIVGPNKRHSIKGWRRHGENRFVMRLPCRLRRRDHRTEPPHAARGPRHRSNRDGGTRTRVLGKVHRRSRGRREAPERGGLPARSVPPADAGVLLHLAVRKDDFVLQTHVCRDRFSPDGVLLVLRSGRGLGA